MWSDRYHYFNIVSDISLSVECNTETLVNFLKTQFELTQISNFEFKNSNQFPQFISLLVLRAKSYNSWSDNDFDPSFTNMLTVVCAKKDDDTFEKISQLLIKIARFLGCRLINEEIDDGEEDFIVWQPETYS